MGRQLYAYTFNARDPKTDYTVALVAGALGRQLQSMGVALQQAGVTCRLVALGTHLDPGGQRHPYHCLNAGVR